MKNFKALICFAAAMFCSVATADSLKFKFTPGDKYSLVSVTEQRIARVVDGNELAIEQTTQLECDFDVEEVDEADFAWVKYVYRRVTMKVKSAEVNFAFDSDANQSKTPIQVLPLRLVVGEGLYLRITPQGRIEKINGLQVLITSAKAKMGNFDGADMVSQAITQRFVEPTIRRELENQLRVFPEPNEGGATWSRSDIQSFAEAGYGKVEQAEEANIVSERTFRLNPGKSAGMAISSPSGGPSGTGSRGGVAVVDVNLVIKTVYAPVLGAPAPESYAKASREILGSGVGQVEIEEATGRIISSKMAQDTTESVKYAAQGQMRRPPAAPEPTIMHTVMTFQMTKIEGAKPVRPADANEK